MLTDAESYVKRCLHMVLITWLFGFYD